MTYTLELLPLKIDIETKAVLKKLALARAALAELKGVSSTVPNVAILLNTIALQEAKDSSAIENIVTTHDELFRAELDLDLIKNVAAKEVQHYATALKKGYEYVKKNKIISNSLILNIHQELEQNDAGFRKVPGTDLKNDKTKEVVYTPPQDANKIVELMANLVQYMNDDEMHEVDPIIKMAIIHHQFESIHPFYDGNGRIGRILNILFLIAKDLLDFPSLYLSRFITQSKAEYYRLLQLVRVTNDWEAWILYVLEAVESVSNQSIILIKAIKQVMQEYKTIIREDFPKIYSQDLINNLFKHPYTKIDFLQKDLNVRRQTVSKYLNEIVNHPNNLLSKMKIGRDYYFINNGLMKLFTEFDYNLI